MWRSMASSDLGLMSTIDRCFSNRNVLKLGAFPCLHDSPTVFTVSDYSGSHKSSRYECFTFALLGNRDFTDWDKRRVDWRSKRSLGPRTFAFKKLGDKVKANLLQEFLALIGDLEGICVSFVVDKGVKSLFEQDGTTDFNTVAECWPKAKYGKSTFDRLLRISHFNCFLLAGMVSPKQNVVWITDQDEIASNEDQLRALTDVFCSGLCRYLASSDGTLPFTLGHIRCGTTASDNGTLQIEDIASIPDLVGGALSEVWTRYSDSGIRLRKGLDLPPPSRLSSKTKSLMDWMTETHRLRHLTVCIEPAPPPSLFVVTIVDFLGAPLLWLPY